MTGLSIRARFPLGTFLGHEPTGQPSALPSTARLYSALVHSAGTGSSAVIGGDGDLTPSPEAIRALTWMEENPPTALQLPQTCPVSAPAGRARSWRLEGVFDRGHDYKTLRPQSDAVTLAGPIGWAWDGDVPDTVVRTLEALCADVSCLGESDSPVVLELASISPTHIGGEIRNELVGRSPGEIRLETPAPGRFEELEGAHRLAYPRKRPSAAADKHSWGARAGATSPGRSRIREHGYRPVREPSRGPWVCALELQLDNPIPPAEQVRWAVVLHRSLVAALGPDATPLVTGAYGPVPQPPNRVAIQYLLRSPGEAAILVMLPAACSLQETRDIHRAAREIKVLHRTRSDSRQVLGVRELDARDFWRPIPDGYNRLWESATPLIPDTRCGRGITFETLALVAVGYVFRDRFPSVGGRDRYRQLAAAVRDAGVRVVRVNRIADSRIEQYVHKAPQGVVVQPYRATYDLGGLVGTRELFALGQGRHLGSGLMVPLNVEEVLHAD